MIILLAEDHVLSQAMTVRLLQADGHEVSAVGTGLQAVDACRDQSFDVVLMDLQLPVLDGLSAIRAIRAMQNDQGQSIGDRLAIWALTADSSSGILTECLEAGADGLLTKPLQPKQFIERLRNVGAVQPERQSGPAKRNSGTQRNVLLESVGQDEVLAKSLVDLFLRDYDSLVDRFRKAFEVQDFQTLSREAHSLKSPARVFGATVLHCLCDDLERVGKTSNADQLSDIQDRFLCELNRLSEDVATFRFE